ncbi:cytochrome c maturation protein CcmE [Amylibacter sp.]|jgi:cytochrome c-type biogenesis protein CcmE|nr:cytochrome c maturation protein CcmE [Amylibacter sp.]MDA9926376.1 cytochrome c maturation protein CcmE [Amylibacter sp.]MDB4146617.1 cytochrome c maturation protein CcmE [Amylibacter sp.]MDB9919281.1 cytochrome c maturation protein CcmE [Amylibacter sp.]MDC0108926.1 cytochrome c maturation protein CcmE [Amylibacter sp.]|tara:strand:- start:619 stop:1053 length:435 start_codon:yes stop_codon:yes gene_type:complete
MAMGLKKRRRIQLIVIAVFFLIVASILIGFAFKDGIEFFRSPSQVVSENINEDEVFRIGGLVKENSLLKDGNNVSFIVTDRANEVEVKFVGILPDLFSEGTGMIATGRLKSNIFEATEILAKHDENYMPKEVADALKEQGVFQE